MQARESPRAPTRVAGACGFTGDLGAGILSRARHDRCAVGTLGHAADLATLAPATTER